MRFYARQPRALCKKIPHALPEEKWQTTGVREQTLLLSESEGFYFLNNAWLRETAKESLQFESDWYCYFEAFLF